MLRRLHVKNFALIDDLEFEFSSGFNVLSGETGAGKSIVIGAIGLILGERATTSHVREGAGIAIIEAVFEISGDTQAAVIYEILKNAGIEEPEAGEPLIIAREVYADGRSSIGRVNGRTVPVSFLKEIGSHLVDVHGQHQHQSLLRQEKHIEFLDAFGSESIMPLREEFSSLIRKKNELIEQLNTIGHDARERERRLELLAFQIDEIDKASLSSDEEEQLKEKHNILVNSQKIIDSVSCAYSELTEGDGIIGTSLRDQLGRILHEVNEAASFDPSLKPVAELVESASVHLEEASMELGSYRDGISFNPHELEEIQERLELIRSLKRKYGETVEEVISFAEKCREEYEMLQNSEKHALQLESDIKSMDEQINKRCEELKQLRMKTAGQLEESLHDVFPGLSLEKAIMKIHISPAEITSRGADRVEFLFSANPGEPPKPLVNIISGGEVSRVMLALKTVFVRQDPVPTLIFDEVDSGIGGAAILAVAEKLAGLSLFHQVMVVTHSPQVASMADSHYLLYKEVKGERTHTLTRMLQPEERKEELARMLDGGTDPVNIKHVGVLLDRAEKYKKTVFNKGKM